MKLTVLQNKICSGASTITNNEIRFSAVCLSGLRRLTGTLAFLVFPFYPNKFILLGGTPLGGCIENNVDIAHLLEAGFD